MNYIYQLLDKIPKREYPPPVRMNISRIDSGGEDKIGITTTDYWVEHRKGRENPSPIKVNISRINSLGNKNKDYDYLFTG